VKEFNKIDIHGKTIEFSDELSWYYEQAYEIKNIWRAHYNYSLTDPRYLEADEATIYADYLMFSTKKLASCGLFAQRKKEDKNSNIKTEADLIKAIEKDCNNIRMNKENYATPEFIQECEDEKKRLWSEYMESKKLGKPDAQIAQEMGERFQRLTDISKLKYADKLDQKK